MVVFAQDAEAQCGMCKAVAESENVGAGLNLGIIYLMAAPYILFAIVFHKRIWRFYKEFRGIYDEERVDADPAK